MCNSCLCKVNRWLEETSCTPLQNNKSCADHFWPLQALFPHIRENSVPRRRKDRRCFLLPAILEHSFKSIYRKTHYVMKPSQPFLPCSLFEWTHLKADIWTWFIFQQVLWKSAHRRMVWDDQWLEDFQTIWVHSWEQLGKLGEWVWTPCLPERERERGREMKAEWKPQQELCLLFFSVSQFCIFKVKQLFVHRAETWSSTVNTHWNICKHKHKERIMTKYVQYQSNKLSSEACTAKVCKLLVNNTSPAHVTCSDDGCN